MQFIWLVAMIILSVSQMLENRGLRTIGPGKIYILNPAVWYYTLQEGMLKYCLIYVMSRL
jgi:hypothetical protein